MIEYNKTIKFLNWLSKEEMRYYGKTKNPVNWWFVSGSSTSGFVYLSSF